MPAKCGKNEHAFLVSGWKKSASKDTAFQFTCSSCLMTVEMSEYEMVREHHNKVAKERGEASDKALRATE